MIHKFTIFSKDNCPYCVKVKRVMEIANLDHKVVKLDEDFTREEFYKMFGFGSTFPQVMVGHERLGGSVETVKYLKEHKLV